MLAWEEHKIRLINNCEVMQLMDKANTEMKKANNAYIKNLAEIILFCGRQEIALRGDNETEHSLNRGNFLELVNVIARHDSKFAERLAQVSGNATYLSPQIQNEIVVAIGDVILDKICSLVSKSGCFALMADETKDASKIEQISVILRSTLKVTVGLLRKGFWGLFPPSVVMLLRLQNILLTPSTNESC